MAGLEAAIRSGDVVNLLEVLEGLDAGSSPWPGDDLDDVERGLGLGSAWSALHLASFLGCKPAMLVLLLCAKCKDAGRGGGGGGGPAFRAALERGTAGVGATALMCAAAGAGGQEGAIALLLDRGADLAATDDEGTTALMCAAENGHTATAALLLDRGADIAATDSGGDTALHHAAQFGHTPCVALLLDRSADVNSTLHDGRTALM